MIPFLIRFPKIDCINTKFIIQILKLLDNKFIKIENFQFYYVKYPTSIIIMKLLYLTEERKPKKLNLKNNIIDWNYFMVKGEYAFIQCFPGSALLLTHFKGFR